MASLVEELINVLTEEEKVYRTLAANGEKKRQIIIDADIPALEAITDLDQQAGDELLIMSNKQVSLLTDIANVLGKSDDSHKADWISRYTAGYSGEAYGSARQSD